MFSREDAVRQHAEMVSVYEENGVNVHFLEPDPHLPYQVFARDSSINVPEGPIVTQCAQWWRRGEYAPVIRFYQQARTSRSPRWSPPARSRAATS